MNNGWMYYNHAIIPTTGPHEECNINYIKNTSIWKFDGKFILLARWTTDFDCKGETPWWYIVRDAPFVFDELSSKNKKHIKQALKKCNVKIIDPVKNIKDLFSVYKSAFSKYKLSDNEILFSEFKEKCVKDKNNGLIYWGGFSLTENKLIGYMIINLHDIYAECCVAKFHPDYLKYGISYALYYNILDFYLNNKKYKYLSSGARSINHITNTQEYKIKTFGYRKAYCKLHIKYNPIIGVIVSCLYPFRNIIKQIDFNRTVHQIVSLLHMEEIARQSNKNE